MKRVSFAHSKLNPKRAVQEAEQQQQQQQLQGVVEGGGTTMVDVLKGLQAALAKSKVTVVRREDNGVNRLWTECNSEDAEVMFHVMAMVPWGVGEGEGDRGGAGSGDDSGSGDDGEGGSGFSANRVLVIAKNEAQWKRMQKLYGEARERLPDLPKAAAPQKIGRGYSLMGMNEDIAKREDRFVLFVPGHADKWLGHLVSI
jgi:hypothetical protein